MDTIDSLSELTTELRDMLDERSAHWPFKRKSTLGTTGAHKHGPPPTGTRKVSATDDWVCKRKGPYVQICRGPNGRKKRIVINSGYKKGYNHAYRAWQASKHKKAKKKKG